MSFDAVAAKIESVEGWLTLAQAERLYEAVAGLPDGAQVAEIGAFQGRSTIVLASALPEGSTLISVDPHGGGDRGPREITPDADLGNSDHEAFLTNLASAGVAHKVRHIRKTSDQAFADSDAPAHIHVLFVDGAHRLGPVLEDLECWGGLVAPGGVMFVHDAFSSVGVTLGLLAKCFARAGWRYAGRTGSLAEYRRVERLKAGARVGNAARQLAQLVWFARNLAVKVLIVARLRPLTRLLGHRRQTWPY